MSIVEMAQEEAELRGNVHIQAVHLRLGLLSGVVKDALLSSYEMACASTALEGSRLIIDEIPVEIYCANCRTQRPVHSIQYFCCAECGTPSAEVTHGKELEVFALEIRE
jgi:hydrogenase nickel incorporation protein HypA/HybF